MSDFSDEDFKNLIDSAIVGGPGMTNDRLLGELSTWSTFTLADAYTPRPPLPYLVTACASCNRSKRNKLVSEWKMAG